MKTSIEKGVAILCVDGSTLLGDALNAIFATAGYSVERVCDGDEAWLKLSEDLSHFDVLITDCEISRTSALRLIGRARDAGYVGRVIIHGDALSDDDVELCWQMGVESVVANEIDAARLLGVVKAFHRQQ